MRVLVTGGAGFIGSHLSDRLQAEGHQVSVVDDLSSGRREQVPAGATFHQLSVTSEWLGRVLQRERPEVIYHLAAQIDVRRSVRDPLGDALVNVLGTVRLLEGAVAAGVGRVVFFSSGGAVYGDTAVVPTPESHPLLPASPYGAAKAGAEGYLVAFASAFPITTAVLRPGNVFGPRQDPHGEAGVVAIFSGQLLRGEAATVNGDGLQTRDYVFVADVVEGALRVLQGPTGVYNLGTGRETTVLEVAGAVAMAVSGLPGREGRLPPPRHGPAAAGEQRRSCLDCSLALERLSWAPAVGLEEGVRRTVAYFAGAGGYL